MWQKIINFFSEINPIVIFATLIVLIKYTYETYKLRKETERQTELNMVPFLVIVRNGDRYFLKNMGFSAALNIKIDPIRIPDTNVELIFPEFESLLPKDEVEIPEGKCRINNEWDHNMGMGFLTIKPPSKAIEINIRYKNLLGKEYVTKEMIINQKIEFKEFK